MHSKINLQIQQTINNANPHNNTSHTPKKWTLFLYYSPVIRKITNLLRETNICVPFHSTNTVCDILQSEARDTTNEYTESGIYRLDCSTCGRCYVGQTSQNFKQSYQKYGICVTPNDPLSACAGYILDNVHEHRPIGSMLLLTQMNRTSFVIAFTQFHIHLYSYNNQFVSNQSMGERNARYPLTNCS